ncbi:SCO2523 family variant P-loop protein [Nocardia sp. NPDC055053]
MIVFAAAGLGGAGRSVTSCNLAYRLALRGITTAYLDFDFGSPTAGAIFDIPAIEHGAPHGTGLHSYLSGHNSEPSRVDVRTSTDRDALRSRRSRGGKLVLIPGDDGGGELIAGSSPMAVSRCRELLLALDTEFKVVIVDLSAGRSVAARLALEATSPRQMQGKMVGWLVFHRWTRQHLLATHSVVYGASGLLQTGVALGYGHESLLGRVRFVRTAVPNLHQDGLQGGGASAAWMFRQHETLRSLAARRGLGTAGLLGETPVEPVLTVREQIVLDSDVEAGIANRSTVAAFVELARRLVDQATWEPI